MAREQAHRSHLIVTNHSLLAIDAIEGVPMIPDYDVVVVDEAHELVARVTQAATDELAVNDVERAARRSQRHVGESNAADDLADAGDALQLAMDEASPGRFDEVPEALEGRPGAGPRRRAGVPLGLPPRGGGRGRGQVDAGRTQARGLVQEVFVTAERMAADPSTDVLWLSEGGDRHPAAAVRRAAAGVGPDARQAAQRQDRRVHLGDLDARRRLLLDGGLHRAQARRAGGRRGRGQAPSRADDALPWRGLDAGSPFDYGRQAILYVARHLPTPGRDGLGKAQLDEIVELVDAAEGRTLGLFSSRRAAETAAAEVRERLPHLTTLAQGDAQLPELARQFVEDPHTCLFGTLSLWQGLDVPGETCQLVLIDRIPFPRPDDPLMSARQRAADQSGGNGFMQVAATHAALLLAQGSGRLIRTATDRGVVAVLDPRLVTARYGGFLKASLPPMWATTDPDVVRQALKRLADGAAPVAPEVILKPSQITSHPISTSTTQWLPVPTTTSPVIRACSQPPIRIQRRGGVPLQHHRHPQRPAGVQRREGRQLVGQPAETLGRGGVAAPPPVTRGQRQHVGVPAEQPGRRGGQQQVGDQRDDRGDEQGAAGGHVDVGAAAVEPDQHHGGDDVVGGGVPEAAEQAQPAADDEDLVDARLPTTGAGRSRCRGARPRGAGPAAGSRWRTSAIRSRRRRGQDDEHLDEGRAPAPGGGLLLDRLPDFAASAPHG